MIMMMEIILEKNANDRPVTWPPVKISPDSMTIWTSKSSLQQSLKNFTSFESIINPSVKCMAVILFWNGNKTWLSTRRPAAKAIVLEYTT